MKKKRIISIIASLTITLSNVFPFVSSAVVTKKLDNVTVDEIIEDLGNDAFVVSDGYTPFGFRTTAVMYAETHYKIYSQSNKITILTDGKTELPVDVIDEDIKKLVGVEADSKGRCFGKTGDGQYALFADPNTDISAVYDFINESSKVLKIEKSNPVYATQDGTVWPEYLLINSDNTDEEIIAEYPGLGLTALPVGDSEYEHRFKFTKSSFDDMKRLVDNTAEKNVVFVQQASSDELVSQNTEIIYKADATGDANSDNSVGLADALTILQYIANAEKYPMTAQEIFNADIVGDGDGVTPLDALEIQKWDAYRTNNR